MTAVADTSPLCYLILIGEVHLLPRLFGTVLLPEEVLAELLHQDAPASVREWASHLPPWIDVQVVPRALEPEPWLDRLQAGESAAIRLAEAAHARIVLLDERAGRRVAAGRGLRVTGTLGILGDAALLGLVQIAPALDRLRRTSFRCSPSLLKAVLDRFPPPMPS